ncbi:MAG: hypothetical protein ABS949_11755 [Solibacillus sp.]
MWPQSDKDTDRKNKDLLVIGNIPISARYKSHFGELGYVVDGTGPFEKIHQTCSKHTNILYSTAFTSHKKSGEMSKEVVKPYILCDSTAPKVMHYALRILTVLVKKYSWSYFQIAITKIV